MKRPYTPYAVARLDGALLYHDILAGFMNQSPIVHFKVMAGHQSHPVWALDDLAEEIFAFCQVAKESGVSETHLQVNIVGTWVSADRFSNIIASNIEWHIASCDLRTKAEYRYAELKNGRKAAWPQTILFLPVSDKGMPGIRPGA